MNERGFEPLTAYEAGLGRELGALSDVALRPVNAYAVAQSVAAGATRRGRWTGRPMAFRFSLLVLVVLLTLVVAGGALLVGSRLRDESPVTPYSLSHLAYELDGDIWVAEFDGANAVKIADGTDGLRYQTPQWSQDGSTLSVYVYDEGGHNSFFYQADREGRGLHEVGRDGQWQAVNVSPTGAQRVVYRPSSMTVINRDGSTIEIPPPATYLQWNYREQASWTPDGSRLIASACTTSDCKSASTHELFSAPLSGAAPTRLTPAGVYDFGGSVSPDGSLVAFLTPAGDAFRVGLVDVDGADHRLLPGMVHASLSMAWAPDSQSVAVGSSQYVSNGIRILSIDPGVRTRVLAGTVDVGNILGFSPDGRWILATWLEGNETALWRVEVDGDRRERLIPGSSGGDWQ